MKYVKKGNTAASVLITFTGKKTTSETQNGCMGKAVQSFINNNNFFIEYRALKKSICCFSLLPYFRVMYKDMYWWLSDTANGLPLIL